MNFLKQNSKMFTYLFIIVSLYFTYRNKETFQSPNMLVDPRNNIGDIARSIPVVSVQQIQNQGENTTLAPDESIETTLVPNLNNNQINRNTGNINRPLVNSNNNLNETTSVPTTTLKIPGDPFGTNNSISETTTTTTATTTTTVPGETTEAVPTPGLNTPGLNANNRFLLDISTPSDFAPVNDVISDRLKNEKNLHVFTHLAIIVGILRILYFS